MSRLPHHNVFVFPSLFAIAILLLAVTAFVGCDTQEEVRTYEIPRNRPAALQPSQDRMLAAMIPRGDSTWFFKVLGPAGAVDSIEGTLKAFVESIEFEEKAPVLDELPDGWRLGADKPMRHASIDINTEQKQLDLSVSRLSRQEDWEEEVRMNVNRWRRQVALEPSQEKWAGAERLDVSAADGPAVWVDLVGQADEDSSPTTPPFAGQAAGTGRSSPMAPPTAAQSQGSPTQPGSPTQQGTPTQQGSPTQQGTPTTPASGASGPKSGLSYDLPSGWREGRSGGMRMAAFEVGPEGSGAEVTVIAAGGDLRGNVARWLGQIRSGSVPEDVVDEAMSAAETVEVSGQPAQRFILTADPAESGTAIDATIVPLEDSRSLFIKMTGPYEIVSQETESMRSFLKSLTL